MEPIKSTYIAFRWILKGMKKAEILSFLFIIFLGVLLSLNNVVLSLATKFLIDNAQHSDYKGLLYALLLFALLMIAQLGVNALHTYKQSTLSVSFSNSIRERMLGSLAKADWQSFCSYHSDDVMTRLTSDIDLISGCVVNVVPNIISLGFNIVAAMAVLLTYEPMLAVFAFILGPSGVLLSRVFSRKIKKYHHKLQESESKSREYLHENLQNMLIVKTFGLEDDVSVKLKEYQQLRLFYTIRKTLVGIIANFVMYFCYYAGYVLALGWGAYRIAISHGNFSFGTFSAFLQLVGQIQGPFSGLASSIPQLIQTVASTERMMKLEEMEPEAITKTDCRCDAVEVQFADVCYAYNESTEVFCYASCRIRPREITAVIGYSGEGKTTMVKLMFALLRPQSGRIVYRSGDRIIDETTVRSYISYVPQGNTLFSGTIKENLLLGNKSSTEEQMMETLKSVNAWDFINHLPEKLNSKIGEHGLGLSEGQAQRIAIARALLRKAPLLILDEATSALDIDSEAKVLDTVRKSSRTCILITHRMSVLDKCNRVLRIQNSGFVENLPQYVLCSIKHAGNTLQGIC